jgi:hypothetical protein
MLSRKVVELAREKGIVHDDPKTTAADAAYKTITRGDIINMTPHPINIIGENGEEIATFPSAGQIRLASETIQDADINGIPTSRTVFGDPEGLPLPLETADYLCRDCSSNLVPGLRGNTPETGDACRVCGGTSVEVPGSRVPSRYYIVSQLVKSALPSRNDLLVPAEVVRDASGNIIGCRSLGR